MRGWLWWPGQSGMGPVPWNHTARNTGAPPVTDTPCSSEAWIRVRFPVEARTSGVMSRLAWVSLMPAIESAPVIPRADSVEAALEATSLCSQHDGSAMVMGGVSAAPLVMLIRVVPAAQVG